MQELPLLSTLLPKWRHLRSLSIREFTDRRINGTDYESAGVLAEAVSMGQHKIHAPGAFEALRDLFPGYPQTQSQILALLQTNGVKLRGDDGTLAFVNLTCPHEDAAVVGLRYRKKDGTQTEDTLLLEKDDTLTKFYGLSIGKALPQYKGTHKAKQTCGSGDLMNLAWGKEMATGVTLAAPFWGDVIRR